MSEITDFPGTWSPTLSYGPDKRYGPTQYQVVKLHVNSPPVDSLQVDRRAVPRRPPAGSQVQSWEPLPGG